MNQAAFFTEPIEVFSILFCILGFVFATAASNRPFFKKLYKFIPPILLCYFIPSILTSFNIISDPNGNFYYTTLRYLLPVCVVLFTLSIDLRGFLELGPKLIIMFAVATLGIILGGPIALIFAIKFFPDLIAKIGVDALWRGMSTVAGTWIGGRANQTAIQDILQTPDATFQIMITMDALTSGIWLAVMLWAASRSRKIDEWLKADTSALDDIKIKFDHYNQANQKSPEIIHYIYIYSIAFGIVGIAYYIGTVVIPIIQTHAPQLKHLGFANQFFWTILLSTLISLVLSFKKKIRELEKYGASKLGMVFLYFLVASVGMSIKLQAIFQNLNFFLIGALWIIVHAIIIFTVARAIRAPAFYACISSSANVGGAATAPIIASAFHPSLASIGVLLSLFGYAIGTYGAWICAQIMQIISL